MANRMITPHLVNESLTDTFQSAYKRTHSTAVASLCVVNEFRAALNRRQGTTVVLVDLSAALNTIDHAILQDRFQLHHDITGVVLLAWNPS